MAMTPTEEIMMMGQRADVPMGNPQAPAPQAPAPQDPMAALMGNEMSLGEGGVERPMPEEAGMSIEQDAGDLVEAIVGRVEGNIEAAVAILDTAKAMLIAGEQEQQQMPIMAADGQYIDTAKDAINQYYNPIAPINRTAQVVDRALGNVPVVGNVTGALANTTGAVSDFGRSLLDRDTWKKLRRRGNKQAEIDENIEDLSNPGISGMKTGGKIPKYASGGLMSAEEARRKLNEYRS